MATTDNMKQEETSAGRRERCLWCAGKLKRYTARESLGICPGPGTAQNIFLIITCMNRKFASSSCKWYQARRDFEYFGGWAGTSKQSWHIREIAWKKEKRLQFSRNKGKTHCLCKNSWAAEHSTGRDAAGEGRGNRASLPGCKQSSSHHCKSSQPQAGTCKCCLKHTWSDILDLCGTLKPWLEYVVHLGMMIWGGYRLVVESRRSEI